MIIGIGTDIIEIERIKSAILNTKGFSEKTFTLHERNSIKGINAYQSFAGYFAAKEAFSKALGTGFRGFTLQDVEVYKDDLGKPNIRIFGKAKEKCNEIRVINIHVSISHNKQNAVAFVVLEGE
ncbi:holo-[acyl-carrier-protein] synthase [Clostridium amylolyticum]|uniref:Holo-[acyl-carrier-protein] synthase n=1 Tax=Clostridium amylolyticum TaxID=1121298 RepID=A0A1M6GZY5_9CLOT|nr:holo-ACP synthase [Clostridium amylolyticum]SHJ15527.1 holo-[acyl-carrier-protein] synthase [Clostridium amylolyticum]